jgi:hypothetical protein
LAGAPPLQPPDQQDLKDLREIKEPRDRMRTVTVIATGIATGTKTAMQAHHHRVREDNIRPKTLTEDGLASETEDLARSKSERGKNRCHLIERVWIEVPRL